jgi:hypothetical protein
VIVDVGIPVRGALVGGNVDAGRITGTSGAVQAVRRNRETAMSFFIEGNYMSLGSGPVVE